MEVMMKVSVAIVVLVLIAAMYAGITALSAAILWWLWSGIVVPVFGAPAVTFLQAWGLWILVSIVGGLFWRSKS